MDYIPLSTLNDFIFCPYSIYLHSVYMESDDEVYKALPQTKGKLAHAGVDSKSGSTRQSDILSLSVYSDELRISGKIDIFKRDKKLLIERKYNLNRIYRGRIYQLWGQYFCMTEMGYDVEELAFYENITLRNGIGNIADISDCNQLMGIEGAVAKSFFSAYFANYNWKGRHPRVKSDVLNVALDIGYTILFNFMECFVRMFGFDIYIGVYHRVWYKRKSLICDLIEPFRCIIDHATLLAFNRKQFSEKDFILLKNEYRLKNEHCAEYYNVYYEALIKYKAYFFNYVQQYYRCFMGRKSVQEYPKFQF